MKIKPAAIEGFLRAPDVKVAVALFYGPDAGLVQERGRRLRMVWLNDPADPFALTEFTGDELQQNPGRLAEEALSMSLTGGARLVHLTQVTDAANTAIKELLTIDRPVARTIVEAGELGPSSKVRKAVEGHDSAMAIPCYRDEERDVARVIRDYLTHEDVKLTSEAFAYLTSHLGGDRMVTRSELEKIALFAQSSPRHPLDLDVVRQLVGDMSAIGLDHVTTSLIEGDQAGLTAALDRLFSEMQPAVMIVRTCLRSLALLRDLMMQIEAGKTVEQAFASARPPIHFKSKPVLHAGLHRWSLAEVDAARACLLDLEKETKSVLINEQLATRRQLAEAAILPEKLKRSGRV